MATELLLPAGVMLPSTVAGRRGDPTARAGSLVRMDFTRAEGYVAGAPKNLVPVTAQALTGNALHPVLLTEAGVANSLANIRLLDGALGFGASVRMEFPTQLAAYWVGKNIAVSLAFRNLGRPATTPRPWRSGAPVLVGDVIWSAGKTYTVTTSGNLGAGVPVHTAGAAANGTAQLTYGAAIGSAGQYRQGWVGPILFVDSDHAFPADSQLVSVVAANGIVSPPVNTAYGVTASARYNHVVFDAGQNWTNGVRQASGSTVGAGGARNIVFGPEVFSDPGLYNAVAGVVALNANGTHLDLTRLAIENLDVSGISAEEFMRAERDYLLQYHPDRVLFAAGAGDL